MRLNVEEEPGGRTKTDRSRNEQVRSDGGRTSSESVKCHEEENIKKTFVVEIRRRSPRRRIRRRPVLWR